MSMVDLLSESDIFTDEQQRDIRGILKQTETALKQYFKIYKESNIKKKMNFRPDIYLGKNQDGSPLRIEEWNYNAYAGFRVSWFTANLLFNIFGFLLSPFFVYLTITMYNGRFNAINVVGLLVGGFLTADALNGGFPYN
jgi:hypothetical protein